MRPLLLLVVLLVLLVALPALAGQLSSPLASAATPPSVVAKLTLAVPAPPPLPPAGIILGWGSSGSGFSGVATFSFTSKWMQPASVDLFTRGSDAKQTPAVGVGVRASAVTKALGINLTGVWATFAGAVRGGVWGSKDGSRWVGGGYYTLDAVQYTF